MGFFNILNVYVCMYLYTHTHARHTHPYTHLHTPLHTHTHTSIYLYIYVPTYNLDGVPQLRLDLLGEALRHGGVQPVRVPLLELVRHGGALYRWIEGRGRERGGWVGVGV